MKRIKVLFVCMGNICRSPAAEGILRHLSKEVKNFKIEVASCAIGHWHVGQSADSRMILASQARGILLEGKAQQFQPSFFEEYDYILAADQEVFFHLSRFARKEQDKTRIFYMTEFSKEYKGLDIPDPYYGGEEGFEKVLNMLEESCFSLIAHLEGKNKI